MQSKYFYVAPNGKWLKPCTSCANWGFSKKGVRCEYVDCYNNNCKDFVSMLKGEKKNGTDTDVL